jgi:hypothetical protein
MTIMDAIEFWQIPNPEWRPDRGAARADSSGDTRADHRDITLVAHILGDVENGPLSTRVKNNDSRPRCTAMRESRFGQRASRHDAPVEGSRPECCNH